MDKKVWIVLGAVLTVMLVGFVSVILLSGSSDEGGDPGPGPLAVACVEAGGEWLGYRCKTAVEIENELRERDRVEFCSRLPQRLPVSQIPERCPRLLRTAQLALTSITPTTRSSFRDLPR